MVKYLAFIIISLQLIHCGSPQESNKSVASRNKVSVSEFKTMFPYHFMDDSVYNPVTDPMFIGGRKKLMEFGSEYVDSVRNINRTLNLDGDMVFVMFTVDTSGKVLNPVVVRSDRHCPSCDSLSIQIAKSTSGRWKPAYKIQDDTVYLNSPVELRSALKVDFSNEE